MRATHLASMFFLANVAFAWSHTPKGGLGTNSTPPYYHPLSEYDFQSINLALNQELIKHDLFQFISANFSEQEFEDAGMNLQYDFLIRFMANQEAGHVQLLQNILGEKRAAQKCIYRYPFNTVRESFDFAQKLARSSESGVYGFLEHLDSRAAASLLLNTVAVDARQQMVFRQFEGLFPMPVWFQTSISQSMAWTLLAPYIVSCPASNPRIVWQNFPALNILNNPNATGFYNTSIDGNDTTPAITHNRSIPLSFPGREVFLSWENPGKKVGYNNSFTTNTTAGPGQFVAWISQLNTIFTALTDVNGTMGKTIQPSGTMSGDNTVAIVNDTMFIAITDKKIFVTPFNISLLNPHIVAGPALYQSG